MRKHTIDLKKKPLMGFSPAFMLKSVHFDFNSNAAESEVIDLT